MTQTLTAKQSAFVEEYLIDLNAKQAAIRVGYSEKTAEQQASRLLSNVKVQNAISKAKVKRSERTQIDADYVLKRHKEIDELDVLDIFTENMTAIRPISEWPKAWRTSISGIDVSELFEYQDGTKELSGLLKKIKMPDKIRNLELLGKHVDVGAYKEQMRMEGEVDMLSPLLAARKRLENAGN